MTKAIIEHGFRFSVHRTVAEGARFRGPFEAPTTQSGTWQWTRDGERSATINYTVRRHAPRAATLELSYRINGESIAYSIALIAQPCRFGGLRWFGLCPRTGRKVSKLYLPNGAKRFLSRQAYRLAYRSQCDAAGLDRACNRRNRLLFKKLKSDDPDVPVKPKWMRWKTYDKHRETLQALEHQMDLAFLRRFGFPIDLM